MPIYEYWCPECKERFDKLTPMGAKDSETRCQRCGTPAKRMLSVVAAVGRGSESEPYLASGGGCGCGGNCACGRHN